MSQKKSSNPIATLLNKFGKNKLDAAKSPDAKSMDVKGIKQKSVSVSNVDNKHSEKSPAPPQQPYPNNSKNENVKTSEDSPPCNEDNSKIRAAMRSGPRASGASHPLIARMRQRNKNQSVAPRASTIPSADLTTLLGESIKAVSNATAVASAESSGPTAPPSILSFVPLPSSTVSLTPSYVPPDPFKKNRSVIKKNPEVPPKNLPNGTSFIKYGCHYDPVDDDDMFVTFKVKNEFVDQTKTKGLSFISAKFSADSVTLDGLPTVEDQGDLGADTAFAVIKAIEYNLLNSETSPFKRASSAVHHNEKGREALTANLNKKKKNKEKKDEKKDEKKEDSTDAKTNKPLAVTKEDAAPAPVAKAAPVDTDSKEPVTEDSKSSTTDVSSSTVLVADSKSESSVVVIVAPEKPKDKSEMTPDEKKEAERKKKREDSQKDNDKRLKKASKTEGVAFDSSELFQYYNQRLMEGTTATDAGSCIRTAIKAINKYGICDEKFWPYSDHESKFNVKPSEDAYKNARFIRSISYRRVKQDINQLREAIRARIPVIGRIQLHSNFESEATTKTGKVTMPTAEDKYLGGRAVMFYGFNDSDQTFNFLNSNISWGKKGYGTIPYSYLTDANLSGDFWIVCVNAFPF